MGSHWNQLLFNPYFSEFSKLKVGSSKNYLLQSRNLLITVISEKNDNNMDVLKVK